MFQLCVNFNESQPIYAFKVLEVRLKRRRLEEAVGTRIPTKKNQKPKTQKSKNCYIKIWKRENLIGSCYIEQKSMQKESMFLETNLVQKDKPVGIFVNIY